MAEISPQQILVPKKVYIGDLAELRCSFNTPSPVLKQLVANGTYELPLVSQSTDTQDDYEISSITLSPAGVDFYQLTVSFIPWKTGELQFPPLTIEDSDLTVNFQPIQIVSLISTESNNTTTLRDTAAPLLLPGTAYKMYGALIALIILLIVILRIIIKRKSILFYLNTKRLQRKYKKNKKQTIRALQQISNEADISSDNNSIKLDALTAEKIQKLLRTYLEIRFDYPFTRAATSEMMKGWQTATSGLLSDTKEEAFGEIAASFIRTDFIRYSQNAGFEKTEIKELINKIIDRIELLEKEEKTEGENNA